jgi:hypothetical protein
MVPQIPPAHEVKEVPNRGFIASWHGQQAHSIDGAIHYFLTEWDARMFLRLCDSVGGMPAISDVTPAPPRRHR